MAGGGYGRGRCGAAVRVARECRWRARPWPVRGRRLAAARVSARNAGSEQPRNESELAREICLRQLAVRPRTRVELAKALARREISEEVIAEVLDRYDEVGIIDDAAFARAWVSTRHQGRGLARRALANELRQHGVEAEVATEALEALDDETEAAAARALVDRKLRTIHGTPESVFRRLVGMLARKGYPAGHGDPRGQGRTGGPRRRGRRVRRPDRRRRPRRRIHRPHLLTAARPGSPRPSPAGQAARAPGKAGHAAGNDRGGSASGPARSPGTRGPPSPGSGPDRSAPLRSAWPHPGPAPPRRCRRRRPGGP